MRALQWALIITIKLMFILPAAAQTANPQQTYLDPRFVAILESSNYRSAVVETAQQSTSWKALSCEKGTFALSGHLRIWQAPAFNSANIPVAGIWGVAITATGCGTPRRLNVMTAITQPGESHSVVLLPGDTAADPVLQQNAARYAFVASVPLGCAQAYIDNTKAVGKRSADTAHGDRQPTIELWTIVACGIPVSVQIQFMPSAGGTDVVAHKISN